MTDYAYKENNIFVWPVAMPSKFNGIGGWHTLTDAQRAVHGWYPVQYINSVYDPETQTCRVDTEYLENDVYIVKYSVTDIPLETLIEDGKQEINKIRYERSTSNIPHTSATGTFYYFHSTEEIAEFKQAVNEIKSPDIPITYDQATGGYWRSNDDTNVPLTEAEFVDLSATVTLYVAGLGRESHIVKANIDSATTKSEIDALVEGYKNYDPLV